MSASHKNALSSKGAVLLAATRDLGGPENSRPLLQEQAPFPAQEQAPFPVQEQAPFPAVYSGISSVLILTMGPIPRDPSTRSATETCVFPRGSALHTR